MPREGRQRETPQETLVILQVGVPPHGWAPAGHWEAPGQCPKGVCHMCSPSGARGISRVKAKDGTGGQRSNEQQWEQGKNTTCTGMCGTGGADAALIRQGFGATRLCQAGAAEPGSSV